MKEKQSLINILNPEPNSTVMIYDVHASESGALAILDDLYRQIKSYPDKSIRWIFIVSTPEYEETDNIIVLRFPWVKKNWGFRYYFDTVTTKKLIRNLNPDQIFSLQNKGVGCFNKEQVVYLHLPFVLTDHRFTVRADGKKLWLYQNIVSKSIFRSLRKVKFTIVQTHWMKEALVKKAKVDKEKVIILQPDISTNCIGTYVDSIKNRHSFFYPATAFSYKNHMTMLKALNYAKNRGLKDYSVMLTIKPDENELTRALFEYAQSHQLNVMFEGQISREKVFEMYAKSVLLFPSYVESFGLPLLEARMSGTYIIASDCPFSHEILSGYDKAKFFEEMDYKKMGELILDLEGMK
ncbi:MAG: glycosyltransferase [Oliverpabstia sp.]|nr:glycosyltransferase [Oliverpabstia sp.]